MTSTEKNHAPSRLRWGLLAAGGIAAAFAEAISGSDTGEAVAVAARDADAAARFAARHGIDRSYGGYQALLEDPEVDVVYISTPHTHHAEWAIAGLQAGKHVVCEKPLAINAAEAARVVEAAEHSDAFMMEGFMYRLHPQMERVVDMIREGTIGEVHLVEVAICFGEELSTRKRLFDRELGGGAILDVGGYCTSISRLIAAAATDAPLSIEPTHVSGVSFFDHTAGVDEQSLGVLRFDGGMIAQLACGVRAQPVHRVRVSGSDGELTVAPPAWLPVHYPAGTRTSISITHRGELRENIEVVSTKALFAYEADHVAKHLRDRQSPILPWADTLANMKTLDRWRASVGLAYDFD